MTSAPQSEVAPPEQWTPNSFRRRLWVALVSTLVTPVTLVVRFLPNWTLAAMAALFSRLLRTFSRRDVRILRRNIQGTLGFEPGSQEAREFEKRVFDHAVRSALDTLVCIYRPSRLRLEGLEELEEQIAAAEAAGRGHLIVTGHLGSWEIVGLAGARAAKRTFHVLAKRSKVPAVTLFLEKMRSRTGSEVLWIGSRSLLRQMLRALERGESLGFVMDQKPEGRRGPVVDFFGLPTEFVKGPATLTRRTRCAVIAVFALREGPCHYRLSSETLLTSGHQENDELALTQLFARKIEQAIRLHPEQWSWSYRRWYFEEESSSPVTAGDPR